MAGFLRSASKKSDSRFARLSFEQLEARDCPALISLNVAVNEALHEVTLTGQLTDGLVGNVEVRFSGAVTGSTYTDANGNYAFITNNAVLGTVYAVGVDQGIEISEYTWDAITSNQPGVAITSIRNDYNVFWTVTGYVVDEHTDGLEVVFGMTAEGMMNALIGEDGTFEVTFYIQQSGAGNTYISAMTTDWWGQDSNVAMIYMA